MKLELTYYGNPILRRKGSPIETVTEEIRNLIKDMIDTMLDSKGVGLAAPQVGHSLALYIAYPFTESELEQENFDEIPIDPERIRVFINPKIISYSKDKTYYSEGCLSIPGLEAEVERPAQVIISGMDLEGNQFRDEFHDFNAHIILHENDHINGVLFIDRLSPKQRKKIEPKLRQIKQRYN